MLTVRIEPDRTSLVIADARRRLFEHIERVASRPMIPSAHRAMHVCTCYHCGGTFWNAHEYANECRDSMCVASRHDDEGS